MKYTKEQYFKEIELLEDPRTPFTIPSKECCQMFLDRVTEGWDLVAEEHKGRDMEDYCAWGYALHDDIDECNEDGPSDLKLWEWTQIYGLDISNDFKLEEEIDNMRDRERLIYEHPSFKHRFDNYKTK